jgi:hypothetical protein
VRLCFFAVNIYPISSSFYTLYSTLSSMEAVTTMTRSTKEHLNPLRVDDFIRREASPSISAPPAATMTLLDILSNSLIQSQMVPYLPLSSRFALAATSKPFHAIIFNDSSTFRHLNLATIKGTDFDSSPIDPGGINWRTERMDEALTEDEFYSGPIYGIFAKLEKQQWLRFVSTLVLDGLAVPADLVREIISEDRFNVRILSIREAKHLNVRKLCQVLNYAVRPTRAVGMPKLRGLYVFGPMEPAAIKEELAIEGPVSPTRYSDSQSQDTVRAVGAKLGAEWNQKSQDTLGAELIGARDKWYQSTGAILPRKQLPEWADTLRACEGIIYFDAVLCRGPRHEPPTTPRQIRAYLPPAVATIALGPEGCNKCGHCPEGFSTFGQSPAYQFPLLSPPPCHGSTVRGAQTPTFGSNFSAPRLLVRCADCLKGRRCERCRKWWCEPCYHPGNLTELQQTERVENMIARPQPRRYQSIKVYMGLCVDFCYLKDTVVDGS